MANISLPYFQVAGADKNHVPQKESDDTVKNAVGKSAQAEPPQKPAVKPLEMSFSDWKKSKDAQNKPTNKPTTTKPTQAQRRPDDRRRPTSNRPAPFFIGDTRNNYPFPIQPPPPVPQRLLFPQRQFMRNLRANTDFSQNKPARANLSRQTPPARKSTAPGSARPAVKADTAVRADAAAASKNSTNSVVKSNQQQPQQQVRPKPTAGANVSSNKNNQPAPGKAPSISRPTVAPNEFRSNNNDGQPLTNTPWIMKPEMPPPMLAVTPEEKEKKKRMWQDYRQAMKPFKNRDFANAKRIIQRYKKRDIRELDEIELARLKRAQDQVAEHKLRTARWVRDPHERTGNGPQNAEGNTANGNDAAQPKAQIFVRRSAMSRGNSNSNRGSFHGNAPTRNMSWGGPPRQHSMNNAMNNTVNSSGNMYGNRFSSGGYLHQGQMMR